MNTLKKRLLSAICMVAFSVCFAVAQTNTIKHTVDRGETLASIAKHYATTEAKIIELNPDAAQFVYVGMELTIPVVKVNDAVKKDNPKPLHNNFVTPKTSDQFITNSELNDTDFFKNDDAKFEKEVFVGASMNNFVGDDIDNSDMKIGFNAGFTARYYFVKDLFLEGSLGIATKGYKLDKQSSSGQYWDENGNYDISISTKYTSYNLDLPILVGYKLTINDDLNIKLKVGPYLTYALSGKLKEEGYSTTYPDIHSSETEHINKETQIGDMDGFKNFGYGIHAGISAGYKKFVLSASYQRAFSKVINNKKSYEQNILISLGYRF